jgi:hypothetical protein
MFVLNVGKYNVASVKAQKITIQTGISCSICVWNL